MSIKTIEIMGYRSLSNIKLDVQQMTALIGENGSGKSNILSALNYFYQNLTKVWDEKEIFDTNNMFRNEVCIRVSYDCKNILKIIQHNQRINADNYEKYYQKIQGITKCDELILEMRKRKGKRIEWNVDYNVRQIIAALFPIYFVDARNIMLTDWTNLWDLLGDLIKLRYEDSEQLQNNVKEIVESSDKNMKIKLKEINRILEKREINVKSLTARQRGKIIAELLMGGQMFQYGERNLEGYSNGTNAYNYTNLLIEILVLLKVYKLKEPIVILDEPEISLHNTMVDNLMYNVFQYSDRIQFFISTHSSRCVKDLFEWEEENFGIYHVALKNSYSQVRKVKRLSAKDIKERVVISEVCTNSCFAKLLLNVEGETEMEVLKNKYLRLLFPFLKEVEIVKGMSNQTIYNLTMPSSRNYQTPGLAVMDMDKVLCKKSKENRFSFRMLKGYPTAKETYYYGEKRRNTLYLQKRIKSMCEKCNFFYKYPLFSCEDKNYILLLELIFTYCENYNIFVWKNTIEGALITLENLPLFMLYMREELDEALMRCIQPFIKRARENDKLNYVRMVFSGKCDYLLTKKQIGVQNKRIVPDLLQTLEKVKKTSGWVSRWLEYYFLNEAGIEYRSENAYWKFYKWIQNKENEKKIKLDMKKTFHELYCLIEKMNKEMTL